MTAAAPTRRTRLVDPMADQQLAALRSAQQIYDNEFAPCPRSPEWKLGARAGVWKAMGLMNRRSPYASGTAQDDAWRAGFNAAFGDVRHLQFVHQPGDGAARGERE